MDTPIDTATIEQLAAHQLTARQRMVAYLSSSIATDMDRGTLSEQHTAALLRVVADAVTCGYERELVALAGAWRREVEAGQ